MTELALTNVLGYSVQLAALVGMFVLLSRILPVRDPRAELALWQGGFLLAGLPLALMWTTRGADGTSAVHRVSLDMLATAAPVSGGAIPWNIVVVSVLGGGIAVRLALLALGWMRIGGWVAGSSLVTLEEVAAGEDLLPAKAPAPAIRVTVAVPGPVTVGLWRPVVLLPRAFLGLPLAARRAVLCHELLHARRRDPCVCSSRSCGVPACGSTPRLGSWCLDSSWPERCASIARRLPSLATEAPTRRRCWPLDLRDRNKRCPRSSAVPMSHVASRDSNGRLKRCRTTAEPLFYRSPCCLARAQR